MHSMLYRDHTRAVVGWVLGWALLLSVVPGSAAPRYVLSPLKSQLQFKAYSLLVKVLTKRLTMPITVEQRQDEIVVQGSVSLNRRDLGVRYNAFFNPVRDAVDVTFTIVGIKS